jgi:hypothetical protein
MMQYERRFEKKETIKSIEGMDLVLKYAPLLLDFISLDRLASLLASRRRIDKNTTESYSDKLAEARARMWDVHRLWGHLERNPQTRQDELAGVLGGDQNEWRSVAEAWEKMGLLTRSPEGRSYCLTLSTRMGEVVPAKCSACGVVSEAPKAIFLEKLSCPDCDATAVFVLLRKGGSCIPKE